MNTRQKVAYGYGAWGAMASVVGRAMLDGHFIAALIFFAISVAAHQYASKAWAQQRVGGG